MVCHGDDEIHGSKVSASRPGRKLKGGLVVLCSGEQRADSPGGRTGGSGGKALGSGNKVVDDDHGVGTGNGGSDK